MNATVQTKMSHSEVVDMRLRQAPLRESYELDPRTAVVIDQARSCSKSIPATQPLYGTVVFDDPANTQLQVALHHGVGGDSDLPVPGDILCAAVASCLDSTIRVIANFLGIALRELSVKVESEVDLRGTLRMDKDVSVAFGAIRVEVTMIPEGDVDEATLTAVLTAAEQSCVVLQTLRNPPHISVTRGS
jgi:uncharacterized OsmC-like protein